MKPQVDQTSLDNSKSKVSMAVLMKDQKLMDLKNKSDELIENRKFNQALVIYNKMLFFEPESSFN